MKESMKDQLSRLTGESESAQGNQQRQVRRQFPSVTGAQLVKGSVIYCPLSEDEGLIVTGGYDERKKFFTIIGIAADDAIIGSLLINTNPNDSTPQLGACQFPLKASDYPSILDYDSWLDCSQIFRVPRQKILSKGGYCGKVIDRDWTLVEQFIKETDVLSNAEKREFGII